MSEDDVFIPTPEEIEAARVAIDRSSIRRFISRIVSWTFKPGVGEAKVTRDRYGRPQALGSPTDANAVDATELEQPQVSHVLQASQQTTRRRVVTLSDAVVKQRGHTIHPPRT